MKFQTPDVMGFLRGIGAGLRDKRVWPVAAVLLAAIVAVPLLLSKSSSPAPVAQAPQASGPSAAPGIPAVSVTTVQGTSRLTGKARNPFALQKVTVAKVTATPAGTATATSTSSSSAGGSSSSSSSSGGTSTGSSSSGSGTSSGGSGTSSSGGSSTPANPPSITPNAKPKPAPTGLTSTEAYHVSLSITNASGGLNLIDPLERLGLVPNQQEPLLVSLGVRQGGQRVLFAVQPGTVVTGPGACTPGPIDCQILSLGQDQTERVATTSPTGPSALFAVTGITVDHYASAAAADQARRSESPAGRKLLDKSSSAGLSLFQYEPSQGVIVDLRNLTVGGN